MSILENVSRVQAQIHAAARKVGRAPEEIILMGVTKTVEPQRIREAYEAGLRIFGENRVQEFGEKADRLQDLNKAEWHMIGHLQTNKSAKAAELFAAIDSVDSLRLATRLNAALRELGKKSPVLIEINIGGEEAKKGLDPHSAELSNLLNAGAELSSLSIRGLMTVPPYSDDPERSRPYFRKMRELLNEIAGRKLPNVKMEILSMGMSHDFEIAIEEGATCVRVGTGIFGERPVPRSKD
ncbi:MAG TPA: YggS family pyridoxal phosphate-dependent enzyme [Terriglobales bacterium]|nr:YggS family pyridoxal phosphate-dependent enzyme [Terriglobales bacterium]